MVLKIYEETVAEIAYEVMDEFIRNGNLKDHRDLKRIVNNTKKLLNEQKDSNPEEIIKIINQKYLEEAQKMVAEDKTPGIATGTKVKNGPEINIYDGKTSTLKTATKVDQNTRFDLASCTKLFTAIQFLQYYEHILHVKINQMDPEFKQNATFNELLTFYHELRTNGRIDESLSKNEAIKLLKEAKIVASNIHQYSDIPYMIVRQTISDFEKQFKELFNNQMELHQTGYDVQPNDVITGGNKQELDKVHDPKARVIPYAGHAGIYSTTHDLIKLFDGINNLGEYNKMNLNHHLITSQILGNYLKDGNGSYILDEKNNEIAITRGMMYRQHPLGLDKTEVLPVESEVAFSVAGFTGTWANYDLQNGLTANILTNPLSGSDDGKKAQGYAWSLDKIKEAQIEAMIQTRIVQKVFDEYYEQSEDFNKTYILR